MFNKIIARAVIAFCAISLAACAHVEPPDTLVTQAQESIEHAHSLGAEEAAPLALREANQNLDKAKQAIDNQEYEQAHRFLEKSMVNSELAVARTNAQRSQKAAEQIEQNLDALRKQIVGTSGTSS